ncbi:unnamed protein product [Prunus armeniaca]|uniref:X8 domain-containing protein n=2 Tax=Prunus armeniaca TaxID=36596 RepID=A0A6J5X7C4_PRUAR|nr:unnamed protein product [Prunus armeniaca]
MAKLALPGEISMLVNGQKAWCVAKPAAPQQALQSTLDYACNYADCSPTKKGGSWYDPDRPVHRASFAMKMVPMGIDEGSPIPSSVNSQTSQNSILSMSATIPPSFNISHIFNTPMDRNNFLSWRWQFLDVLEIHDFEDVVKNENRPAKRLEDGSVNPTYAKDKLVLSWIKATAPPSIKTLLISCTSAY